MDHLILPHKHDNHVLLIALAETALKVKRLRVHMPLCALVVVVCVCVCVCVCEVRKGRESHGTVSILITR